MPKTRRIALLALLAAVLFGAPSLAQNILAGQTPGGAYYTIAVPDNWNGGLVIWNHGFSLTPGGPGPSLGPLVPVQLTEGFAVAASSYRQTGWAVFQTNNDLRELVDVFEQQVGVPNQIIITGASLGGAVTVRAVEQAGLGVVTGALTLCGANAGSLNWNGGLDVRLIYDAICAAVPGANIPGGAKGLPPFSTLTPMDIVLRANVCFGHDLPPAARTPGQQARLNRFLNVTQIPAEFINVSFGFFTTYALTDLVRDPGKLGGKIGFGNKNVDYGNAAVNKAIQRVVPPARQRKLMQDNYMPTGELGITKMMMIHTSGDGLVIYENMGYYASIATPGQVAWGVVREAQPSHCNFSSAETLTAWEVLLGWLAGDPVPTALTLQVWCSAIEGISLFGIPIEGPCRFDPTARIPDISGRIRPRQPPRSLRASEVRSSTLKPAAAPAPAKAAPAAPRQAPPQAAEAAPAAETPPAAPRQRRAARPLPAGPAAEALDGDDLEPGGPRLERRNH